MLDAARYRSVAPVYVRLSTRVSGAWIRAAISGAVITAAFLGSAWVGHTPPFEGRAYDPYSETAVIRALPFDTPLPFDISLVAAGRGEDLPYHAQWTSNLDTRDTSAQFNEHLAGSPRWRLTQDPPTVDEFVTTLVRLDAAGYMTHFARLAIERDAGQTIVTLDFSPVPVSLAPD
ncbi:MAG: hypothetical protein HY873_09850 [Chloroflexi bacterium]|nr:hypothetical protein [Chloroflexota bacterium]